MPGVARETPKRMLFVSDISTPGPGVKTVGTAIARKRRKSVEFNMTGAQGKMHTLPAIVVAFNDPL